MHSLTAQLRFVADGASLRQVQSQTASALAGIKGRVDLQLDPRAQASIQRLSASASELRSQMQALSAAAAPAASAIGRMTSAMTAAATAGSSASSGLRAAAASTRQVGAAAQNSAYSVNEFGRQVALAGRRFVSFQVAAGSMGAITRAFREGLTGAIEFDLQLNKLRQVSGDTAAQVKSVGDEVMRLATGLGASSSYLLEAAVTLKQAGLASRDVKTALEGIAQASLAPSFSSMKQVTEGAIAAFQQFGKSASNIKEQLGAVNAVAGDFAVEASDIVATIQKTGGTAAQAGASLNELIAIFTSVRATTRESADSIATGLRTVLSRVQRYDTVESLRQLGIELRHTRAEAEAMGQVDMEGQFVGAYEAVRRLSEGLGKIRTTDPRFASAIEDLGGYRQVSRVIPLIQQFGEAQRALNVARLGSASLEAAAATRQDALATKVAKTREEFQRFANDVVQTRGFRAMVDTTLSLAGAFAQVLEVAKPLVPLMVTLGTVKLAQGITQFSTGLYQGFTGSLGGARPVPARARFASGGHVGIVPGEGSGDNVRADLAPGSFVVRKSSAVKAGYENLQALLTPGEFVFGPAASARLGPAALNRLNSTGAMPRFAAGGPVLRYATGGPGYDLNAIILRVLGKVGYGRDGQEQMSEAGEPITRAVASGRLPTDPAQVEAFLLREASRGAKAASARETRLRQRETTGAVTATGASVMDSFAAQSGNIPLSAMVQRGVVSGATKDARYREYQVLKEVERLGLTGAAAEQAYARLMAASGGGSPTTASAPAVFAPRPVAQVAAPGALRAAAGRAPLLDATPPGVPPTPTGVAPSAPAPALLALPPYRGPNTYGLVPSGALPVPASAGPGGAYQPGVYLLNAPTQPRGPRSPLPAPYAFADDVYDPRTANPYAPHSTPPGGMHPAARMGRRPGESAEDYAHRFFAGDRPSTYRMTPPRVRAESVPDVVPAMPGFGAADVAELRTSAAVDARGGAKMLSTQTALEIQQKEHLRVEQELTRAIERQLRALYPAISATEARRMAEERARVALDRNEVVLRNGVGGVVGTAALGQQLQDAGKNPAGVTGWLGGGTFRERAATLGGRLARSFTPQGGMVGTYGLMMGAPMLGELVGPSQKSVQVAATTGNTFGAQVQGAGASALTLAAMGAGVGMTFGPMGAAIGAAAGGLVGLAQGFNQTAKDIREARLGTSLQRLGDMVSAAANNVSGAGLAGLDPSALKQELGVALAEAEQRTRDATTRSWFNPRRQADLTGLSADDLGAVRTKEVRAALGGQAGAMVSLLSRRAEDLGRVNPDANPADLAKRLSSDSAAGPMLQAVAAVRGESVDKVVREFSESIRVAQRQLRVQREVQAGRLAADQSAAALSRLTDAVTNAAGSVGRFETSMTVLGSVFSGQGGTGRVTSITGGFASFGTGTGIEFRRSAAAVGAALGSSGSPLLKSAEAGDQLARVLPSVLATLGSSPLGPDESYGKKTRDLLYAQLLPGMDDAGRARALESNPELARAIESAVGSVVRVQSESEGDGGLAKRLQQDAGRVAQEVTEAFAGPLREAGERMARAVEDQSNKYVEGLASARQMLVTAGESLDRVGELRLAGARVGADVAADRTGRAATDVLSLPEMQAPFIERQRRLTGLGADAENPAAIAARLRQVTGDIVAATSARDNAVGNRDRFSAAAGNLDRLVGVSNNLQSALRNLASASERAAGLQEKLNAATLNRDSRLSYAEKYTMAGDEQRARMQRGQDLVIGLDRGRVGFNTLSSDEQRLAVETLGDFGQTRLASGRTAEGLRRQLLGSMPGVTDVVQEGERRGLQDQVVGVYRTAEEAQRALADNQRDLHGRFITDLRSLHEQFFARLATNLAAEQVGAAQNGLASAEVARGQLRREEQQRGVLARVGVTGQVGLQGLRASEGDLRSFLDSTDRLNALRGRTLGAGDTRAAIDSNLTTLSSELAGNLFTAPKGDRLREVLASRGLGDLSTGGQQAAIDHVTTQMSDRYGTVDGLVAWELKSRDEQVSYIEGLVRRGLEVGREHTAGEIGRERDRAGDALRARGVNTDALAGLNVGDRSSLTEAVRTSATDLATLDSRIKETEASMGRFKEQLERAEATLRGATTAEGGVVPIRRADGGFTPRGTDTVPAMLTPGEFVVNRAATQANLPLLREINAAKGAVQYHQEGGPIIRRPSPPTATQVVESYLWAQEKIRKGLGWLGFAAGGVVPNYLSGGGLTVAQQYELARQQLGRVENGGANRGPLVGGGGFVATLSDSAANAEAGLRRRVTALRDRNLAQTRRTSVVALSAAEAMAANRSLNAQNMGFSQALARSGMDDGQVQGALGSLAQQRDFQNRVFQDRYGAATADARMRETQGWAAGAGVRRQNELAQRRAEQAARRWAGFTPSRPHHTGPTQFSVIGTGYRGPLGFADGGFVPGSGTGDVVPAMLSPGEFVFSRPAVSALGAANLNRVHRFATGGIVPGGSAGGGPGASGMLGLSQEARTAMDQFGGHSKDLGVALTGFAAPAGLLASAFQNFSAGAEKLAGALEKFKGEVSHSFNGNIVVDVNGAEALNALKGELQTDLTGVLMRQVVDYVGQMFPDAPKPQGVGPAGY